MGDSVKKQMAYKRRLLEGMEFAQKFLTGSKSSPTTIQANAE